MQSPQQRNLVSADAIRGRIASGEILTIREDGSYDRSDVSTWTPPAAASPVRDTGKKRSGGKTKRGTRKYKKRNDTRKR